MVYDDHVLLFNDKFNCYLHVSEDEINYQAYKYDSVSIYRPLSPVRRQNPKELYPTKEVNVSRNFHPWQVVAYKHV